MVIALWVGFFFFSTSSVSLKRDNQSSSFNLNLYHKNFVKPRTETEFPIFDSALTNVIKTLSELKYTPHAHEAALKDLQFGNVSSYTFGCWCGGGFDVMQNINFMVSQKTSHSKLCQTALIRNAYPSHKKKHKYTKTKMR